MTTEVILLFMTVMRPVWCASFERRQVSYWHKNSEWSGLTGSTCDVACRLQWQHHLMNGWCRDIEVSLNVRLRRRAAIDLLVVKDERQVLPLTICKASIAHAVRGYW